MNNGLASDMSASTNTTSSQIPEIAELTRRLAAVNQDDIEGKRQVIKEWLRGLQSGEASKNEEIALEDREEKKRRQRKEVAQDEEVVEEWVRNVKLLFECLTNQTTGVPK